MTDTTERILRLVTTVQKDEGRIGVFSTGERLAVALVLNRPDLLNGYTMLQAVNRLGSDWLQAAIAVERAM